MSVISGGNTGVREENIDFGIAYTYLPFALLPSLQIT